MAQPMQAQEQLSPGEASVQDENPLSLDERGCGDECDSLELVDYGENLSRITGGLRDKKQHHCCILYSIKTQLWRSKGCCTIWGSTT